ncbi:hypothetical protein MVES1_003998 [Malassezia vespertilionis]|uniref:Uncharacterized protein n=1 Tax=Malassezia vespertilionis TaxID=2020962 RepID=A0A2N1J832_9BASI|nr:uncharacterized protein MVES1_003998 [Malassezia vespertilionis]PKI82710.1 hypothetical protein MVES_003546 [Malassezia vespertilionis]WFD08622.1 hypothetical protein MVES1_003998 [Malassezia vespertilionis]
MDARTERAAALREKTQAQHAAFRRAIKKSSDDKGNFYCGPLAKQVRIARANVRAAYMTLLFACPYDAEAKHIDKRLWTDTTYKIIVALRASFLRSDKRTDSTNTAISATSGKKNERSQGEYRRFLREERTFWESFAVKIVHIFSLDEAYGALQKLGLLGTDAAREAQLAEACDAGVDAMYEPIARKRDAENWEHRQHLFTVLQRVLTYCGDLYRYTEMVSHTGKRGYHQKTKPIMHDAIRFYHEAHLLLPDHGHPSNQLAIVATSLGDAFGAVYQSYCATCVPHPSSNAQHNLSLTLTAYAASWEHCPMRHEVQDAWRQASLVHTAAERLCMPVLGEKLERPAAWFESLLHFHALTARHTHLDEAAVLGEVLLRNVLSLRGKNSLRAVDYLRVFVAAVAALVRIRSTGTLTAQADGMAQHGSELVLVSHILGLLTALLAVAREEIGESKPGCKPGTGPTLQRTLPTLRLGAKWVYKHADYLQALAHRAATMANATGVEHNVLRMACIAELYQSKTITFYASYADYLNQLKRTFVGLPVLPHEKQAGKALVAEDAELMALLPFAGVLFHPAPHSLALATEPPLFHKHCCDMARIADALQDALSLASVPSSGVTFDTEQQLFVSVAQSVQLEVHEDPVSLALRVMDRERDAYDSSDLLRTLPRAEHVPPTASPWHGVLESAPESLCSTPLAKSSIWATHTTSPFGWNAL